MVSTSLSHFTHLPKRLEEIIKVLAKYGLADWFSEDSPEFLKVKFMAPDGRLISEYTVDERIRMALSDLGTTFIKLGQMLSTRSDVISPDLARELSKLQQDAPADPPEVIRNIMKAELGEPVEEIFATFDPQAIASASIGQIHFATLHDGTDVAVKVQHPGIEETVAEDLELMMIMADLAEKHSAELRLYQPKEILYQFRRTLKQEMDFNRELQNMHRFIHNFEDNPALHIPRPYPELSTRRVLTMEWIKGFSVGDTDRLREENIDTKALAQKGANIYLDMIFRDGFYHADPHPGNVFVLPGEQIGLLDCGMVGYLDDQTRETFEDLMQALLAGDSEQVTEYLLQICLVPPDLDRRALNADLSELVTEYIGQAIKNLDMSAIFNKVTEIIRLHHIIVPGRIYLLIKVLAQLEGTSRLLDSDFALLETLRPYYVKIVSRRYAPQKLWRRAYRSYRKWQRLVDMLPGEVSQLLELARKGQFEIQLEHNGLDVPTNRTVYGILTAALFLGSTSLWSNNIPPLFFGVSVFGAVGSLLAVALGIHLLLAIRKSGGL
jgi:ubiquinone biosynthesis protein